MTIKEFYHKEMKTMAIGIGSSWDEEYYDEDWNDRPIHPSSWDEEIENDEIDKVIGFDGYDE